MKKIISVILAAAALLTLAACKVKPSENSETEPYRPEEFQAQVSQLQAERASEEAEKQKEQEKLDAEIEDYISEEVGKTKKDKELVVKVSMSRGVQYQKYVYNKKGEVDYRLSYFFYDELQDYNSRIDVAKENERCKIVKKDKDMLMVVVKYTEIASTPFDELYNSCKRPEVIEMGYQVIE